MSKGQYSQAMKEITGINEDDAKEVGEILRIIASANEDGLKLLRVQVKVFSIYIEKRLEEFNDKTNKSTS